MMNIDKREERRRTLEEIKKIPPRINPNIGYMIAQNGKSEILTLQFTREGDVVGNWIPTWNEVADLVLMSLRTEWENTANLSEFPKTKKRKELLQLLLDQIFHHVALIQKESHGDRRKGLNILWQLKPLVRAGLINDSLDSVESFSKYVANESKYWSGRKKV